MKRAGGILLILAMALSFAACAKDDTVNSGRLDSGVSGESDADASSQGTEDQESSFDGGISKFPDAIDDLSTEDSEPPVEDVALEDTSIVPDVVADLSVDPADIGNPRVTDVDPPNLSPPPSGDPIAKACVGLAESFCTGIIAKCNNVSLIGSFVSNPDIIQQCVNIVQGADTAIGQVCDTLAQQANDAVGGNLGILKQFAPTIVNVCVNGFKCTDETLTDIASKVGGLLTGLATGGGNLDFSVLLDVALDFCGPTVSGLIP
ncbi:MAG: hypothetical protein KC609_17640 [Myxococcales bacterium]|nr:hypothetical protein [Myxococcales bacterium]